MRYFAFYILDLKESMLRILYFVFPTNSHKNSFILFFILCFSQFSGQLFSKNGTPITIESGSFIKSDTVISDNKPSVGANSTVQSFGKIYVAHGAVIYDLNDQLTSNIVYVKNDTKRQVPRIKPLKKIKKAAFSIATTIKKVEIVVKKKPVFYKSSSSEEFYSKIGERILAVVGGVNFSIKKNVPTLGIAYKNTFVFFYLESNQNVFESKDHFVVLHTHNTVKMRGPPKFPINLFYTKSSNI